MTKDEQQIAHYIDSLPYNLEQTARISTLFGKTFNKQIVNSVLERDEFFIMDTLLCNPDISQSDVAKLIFKGKAHAGKILTEMEQKGYIKRIVDTKNNMMIKRNTITDKGMKLYKYANQKNIEMASKVLGSFTPEEVATFHGLLNKFKDTLKSFPGIKIQL